VRLRLRPVVFLGTFPAAPSRFAQADSDDLFGLVTFCPERPDLNVPCFRSCIARSTFSDAFSPYFAM